MNDINSVQLSQGDGAVGQPVNIEIDWRGGHDFKLQLERRWSRFSTDGMERVATLQIEDIVWPIEDDRLKVSHLHHSV